MVGRNVYVEQSQTLGVSPKTEYNKRTIIYDTEKKKTNENVRSGILHNLDVTFSKFLLSD